MVSALEHLEWDRGRGHGVITASNGLRPASNTTLDDHRTGADEDLEDSDAWARLRETAVAFGDQRIYASHHSIMLARKACHFVRPKRTALEVVIFVMHHRRRWYRTVGTSRIKVAHLLNIVHRDQVEPPMTIGSWRLPLQDAAAARPAKRRAHEGEEDTTPDHEADGNTLRRRVTGRVGGELTLPEGEDFQRSDHMVAGEHRHPDASREGADAVSDGHLLKAVSFGRARKHASERRAGNRCDPGAVAAESARTSRDRARH
jgi:hypothetical protein